MMQEFFKNVFAKMIDKKMVLAFLSALLLAMLQAGISFLQSKSFEQIEEGK